MARLSANDRRSALVNAALTVIARDGVHAATTRAIVAEADMSLASFHYAYRSRDELIRAVIAFVVDQQEDVSLAAIAPLGDVRSTVRAALQAYFDLLKQHPEREQAMFELMHYSMRTAELGALPAVQHGSYLSAAAGLLEAAVPLLGIAWSRPVDEVARILVALTDGLTYAWLADRNDAAAARLMEFMADTIASFATTAPGAGSTSITQTHGGAQ
ncbi:TetR/AcrR family transcriptional regulator [Lacisediminihabitans changchengi]|uniref:TetR family transcriptional regulator n=1 Tax=Lacisediminihabitans changchengi TaxID=2787634 RepID=A0A934SQL9_9MICO|nr:TetR family transcriptional regulator [Lacisediminihabitans changchengi]MBK4347258.1 TetR family transcriptional regulator [Lacisediminihabitans changchengi]